MLLDRIVQLAEGVAEFEAADVELEALHPVRVVGLLLRERRDGRRKLVDDRGLDEMWFGDSFEEACDRLSERWALIQQSRWKTKCSRRLDLVVTEVGLLRFI